MGTQAQQALERRYRTPSPRNRDNAAGTRQAQGQAMRESAKPGHVAQRKGALRKQEPWEPSTDIAERGYGGYGPTGDPNVRGAKSRVDAGALTRQVLDSISQGGVSTHRPAGSIWDDPTYGPLANEHGANFAMKARNLDRKINSARQFGAIQREALAGRNEMERLKLEGRDLEQANQMYSPPSQTTGTDARGLAVDASGAYTGEGKQAGMVGRGPMTSGEQDALTRAHEARLEGIKSITEALRAELGKDEFSQNEERIQGLQDQLNRLIGGQAPQDQGGGQSEPYSGDTPPQSHPEAKRGKDGVWYVKTDEGYRPVLSQ